MRIIEPSEFGLLAMVTVFSGFINIFIDFGLSSSIIQKKNITDIDISVAFITTVVIAFIMSISLYFLLDQYQYFTMKYD